MIEFSIGFIVATILTTMICSKTKDKLRQENERLRLQLKISSKKTDDID